MNFELDYKNILLLPNRSNLTSRKDVGLFSKFKNILSVPIIAANMDGVGTMEMADELSNFGLMTCLLKTYTEKELIEFFDCADPYWRKLRSHYSIYSMGITDEDFVKFLRVLEQTDGNIKHVCIDVANGYMDSFVDFIRKLRSQISDINIIAGNVVTGDMTKALIEAGADIVKVGIGPGSVCTTRIQSGIGRPQFSAVLECAAAADEAGGAIIADGGCTCPGDIAKAFVAGADFVMLGGMLAGHDEGGGDIVTINDNYFVQFYGMSSKMANEKHFGGLQDYRSSEGREVLIPYRGKVGSTITDILGGLRSACTYIGVDNISKLAGSKYVLCHDTHNRVFE